MSYRLRGGVGRANRQIPAEDMDYAARYPERVQWGRENRRPLRCAAAGCRRLVGPGNARVLYLDGARRGMVCRACRWVITRKG